MSVTYQPNRLFPRDCLLQRIAIATNCLLTIKDYYQLIQESLNVFGLVLDVDRIYTFPNYLHPETGETASSPPWRWVAKGVQLEGEGGEVGVRGLGGDRERFGNGALMEHS